MKLNNLKRIVVEDFASFSKEQQQLIEKLSFALNPALEQLSTIFNKNIDFDNLNQELITFTTSVNASGIPKNPISLRSNLKTKCKGLIVIKIDNLTDNTLLSGSPFISFELNNNQIIINQITGLAADKKYTLTVMTIG